MRYVVHRRLRGPSLSGNINLPRTERRSNREGRPAACLRDERERASVLLKGRRRQRAGERPADAGDPEEAGATA